MAPHLDRKAGTDIRHIKSGALAKAIRAGDHSLENIVRAKARRVGTVMGNLVNVLNPDMIVLGGGVVEAMPQKLTLRQIRAQGQDGFAAEPRFGPQLGQRFSTEAIEQQADVGGLGQRRDE